MHPRQRATETAFTRMARPGGLGKPGLEGVRPRSGRSERRPGRHAKPRARPTAHYSTYALAYVASICSFGGRKR